MILSAIRKSKRVVRFIAAFMVINLLIELAAPMQAFALTGGPSQPEVQSFEPVSANQMVDPFTGDFTYNIPLLDVGGYPINISYHAGPGLDEEASWVGLGWNINPGVINRNMRGIPDDFFSPNPVPSHQDNDKIIRESKMRPSRNYALDFKPSGEMFSIKFLGGISASTIGIRYNNYRGFGWMMGFGFNKLPMSLNFDSQDGFSTSVNYSQIQNLKLKETKNTTENNEEEKTETTVRKHEAGQLIHTVSLGFSSRSGFKGLTLNTQKNVAKRTKKETFNRSTVSSSSSEQSINHSFNGSGSIDFLNSSYIPSTTDKTYNFSYSLSLEFGKEFFGFNSDARIGLSYSESGKLKKYRRQIFPVYGFLNQSKVYQNYDRSVVEGKDVGRALMDYNVYGSSSLNKSQTENELPYTVSTFDVFSVVGQGISGMYRAHSANVGTVYESAAESISIPPISLGLDLGAGQTLKAGVDVEMGYYKSKSGRWDKDNSLFDFLNYSNTRSGADFEQTYFKNAGEKTSADKNFYNSIDWGLAARPEMDKRLISKRGNNLIDNFAYGIKLKNNLKTWGTDPVVTTNLIREKRDKRNQVVNTLSAKEAFKFGLIKYRSSVAKDHHIGQITALNPDGGRYIYAQPVYNIVQKEYSFSFAEENGRTKDISKGLAWFNLGDNSLNNNLTLEEFFDYEEIPPYAHSYLLNAVVSPDYVDITNDGPTPDDNGGYTHIEYSKLSNVYKWRTPYALPLNGNKYSATYQEGLKSDDEDDKASFVYGEKEVFYVKKIETKTHVAFFYISNREDGLGVLDELGARDLNTRLQKLDSIELYTTYDYYNHSSTRKPIKVVYFKYDYSLCPNVPNNSEAIVNVDGVNINANKGKLTLQKIWFKYNNSNAGALSPYTFTYSSNNYGYGYKNYDRWGNYKAAQSNPTNHEFPYSEQDETLANQYASAWSLTEINLPSGGKIDVEYEADDYAYVQDKKAMQMFKIEGVNDGPEYSTLTQSSLYYGSDLNLYYIFKLNHPSDDIGKYLPAPNPADGKRYLYISSFLKLLNPSSPQVSSEYVACYAEIETQGLCSDNNQYGYIKIRSVPINELFGQNSSYGNVHPLARAGWQYLRLNLPHLAYEGQGALRGNQDANTALRNIAFSIISFIPELVRTFAGYNTYQIISGRSSSFDHNKTWIRLQSPNLMKKGGGLRVKKVLINNDWANISGEESQILGQVYDYTYNDPVDGVISSGVASYEPQLGGEENSNRLPSFLSSRNFLSLGPENHFFNDRPLGEGLFPSPSVGYRQVKVRNIKPDEDNDGNTIGTITRHGTGYLVQKFFTAQDFPVYATKTTIDAEFKKSPILSLLKFSQEIVGATQGFAIEINDMHGKPKSMETYDEYDKLISKTEYKYKTDPTNRKRLNNDVTTLKGDGIIDRSAKVGYEVEMLFHPRQFEESGFSVALNSDVDVFFVGFVPIPTPGFGISLGGSHKLVRTATATKVINRYGILESVTVTDQSSSVTTTNKAFDDETGEVLLTETTNEFNDKVYNFTYPSHWAYDEGMGSAYKNIGAYYSNVNVTSGQATFTNADAKFITEGDELIANDGTTETQVWVLDKHNNAGVNYTITFIDREGNSLPTYASYTLKNIRSGRRNMQTIPVGVIVGNTNPVPDVGSSFLVNGEVQMDAINASAASFSDHWQAYRHDPGCWSKDCDEPLFTRNFEGTTLFNHCLLPAFNTTPKKYVAVGDKVNPYILGIKGNWRPDTSYVYFDRGLTTYQRTQTNASTSFNGTNTAIDGHLNTFKPFWFLNGSTWQNRGGGYAQANNPWTWNSRAGQINPDGIELENVNALGLTSSAIYSFVSKQPLAVTYNALLRETLFEGFEDYPTIDYDVLTCNIIGTPPQYFTQPSVTFGGDAEALKLVTTPMQWYLWPSLHFKTGSPVQLGYIYDNDAHTGKKSLIVVNSLIEVPTQVYDKTSNPFNTGVPQVDYHINSKDLTDIFSPADDSKDYLITYWVKAGDLNSAAISIEQNAVPISFTLLFESKPIEGWVKREYKFTFNTIAINDIISVKIANSAQTTALFDDIRIHPLEANMKSFVYDNKKLRLMATLDENNYATFFEYDEEGNLVRTKRETERGIITINENRQNIKH